MTQSISRRTIAKGAAWSVPAVAVGAAAPAFAASLTCSTVASYLKLQGGSTAPSITVYTELLANPFQDGTRLGISMGIWNIGTGHTVNGENITGFYLLPGYCGVTCAEAYARSDVINADKVPTLSDAIVAADGTKYDAILQAYTPYRCSPQTAGAGLSHDITLRTNVPYEAAAGLCNPQNADPGSVVASVSIPYTLVLLSGLAAQGYTTASSCCLMFNATFPTSDDCIPRRAVSYGFSAAAP